MTTASSAVRAAALIKTHGIALTGGVATGKSTVARLIAAAGHLVIDADELARRVTTPGSDGLAAIAAAFGPEILSADGSLDRKLLGAKVFAAPESRRQLEALTHPRIRAQLLTELEKAGLARAPRVFFYEAALIFETGTERDFRSVWATCCAPATQLARLMARGGLARADAERIIAAQLPAETKAARADLVIWTDGDLAAVADATKGALATL